MSKKHRKYTFCIDGDLLECDSLLEIKNNVTENEWERITSNTMKYHCYVKMLRDIGMPLLEEPWEKGDKCLERNLRRTIGSMKRIDPSRMIQFDAKAICDEYAGRMLKGVHEVKDMMKGFAGRQSHGDEKIQVSEL